jgi:hypothetical protein
LDAFDDGRFGIGWAILRGVVVRGGVAVVRWTVVGSVVNILIAIIGRLG